MRGLYKGAIHPYLEEAFFEKVDSLKLDPLSEVVILVPSALTAQNLKHSVASRKGGVAGLKFVTFEGLAGPYSEKSMAQRGLKPLGKQATRLFMKRAAVKSLNENDRLFHLVGLKGLGPALWNTIADLKEARISVADFAAASEKMPDPHKSLEIARVWETYEIMKTENGCLDEKDRYYLLLEDFRDNPPDFESPLIVYGIYDATHLQKELISTYIGKERDAFAFVPWYDQGEKFVSPFIRFLESEGFHDLTGEVPSNSKNVPTARLVAGLFDADKKHDPIENKGEIDIFAARGEFDECGKTVAGLLKRCKSQGIYLDETAVILRNSENYVPLLRELLENAEIPYRTSTGEKLVSTTAGKAMNSLINIVPQNGRTASNMDEFLESAPIAGYDAEFVDAWSRIARQAGIVNWTGGWRSKLEALALILREKNKDESITCDNESLTRDIEALEKLGAFADGLFADLDEVPAKGTWLRIANTVKNAFLKSVDSNIRGFDKVLSILESMAGISEEVGKSDIDEFAQAVSDSINETMCPSPREEDHGILIADIMHARSVSFRAVCVPGLCRGVFPAPIREDPLLLDEEREALGAVVRHGYAPELKKRRVDEEKFLFMLAAGSASDYLSLSYPGSDPIDDRPHFPSSFFIEALETITGDQVGEKDIAKLRGGNRNTPPSPADTVNIKEAVRMFAGSEAENLTTDIPFFAKAVEAFNNRLGTELTAHTGLISDEYLLSKIEERFKRDGDWELSPARIEKYASCPFSFMLESILGIGKIEEAEEDEEVSALGLGNLYHKILNNLYSKLREDKKLPLSEDDRPCITDALARIAAAEFERLESKNDQPARGLMWDIIKQNVLNDVTRVIDNDIEDGEWVPAFFEVSVASKYFGEKVDALLGTEEPVVIDIADGMRLRVKCRIDRIDLSADKQRARVIDYKTGSDDKYASNKLKGGAQIQVAVYCEVARRLLESGDVEVSDGFYWFVSGSETIKKVSVGKAGTLLGETLELILGCVKSGLFHQFSEKGDDYACWNYCPYARACFEFPSDIADRCGDDPALDIWKSLKEID